MRSDHSGGRNFCYRGRIGRIGLLIGLIGRIGLLIGRIGRIGLLIGLSN